MESPLCIGVKNERKIRDLEAISRSFLNSSSNFFLLLPNFSFFQLIKCHNRIYLVFLLTGIIFFIRKDSRMATCGLQLQTCF